MSSVGNLQPSAGKVQLSVPPTFVTHDAAAWNRSWSASDSAYSYIFIRSVVCRLSVVCHIRAPCLDRSTDLDAIYQVHL